MTASGNRNLNGRFGAKRILLSTFLVLGCLGLSAPTALSALSGSGQLHDVVQLATSTSNVPASELATSGAPVASAVAYSVTNSNSNVDTYIRYDWSITPYYGADSSQTSIELRGTTHTIADLLWFRQETVTGTGSTVTSPYFSPLVLENAAANARVSFSPAGNACAAWSGSPASGFSATSAGTFTVRYHVASAAVDDAPLTSEAIHYCLDTTNSNVYLGESASFASATLVAAYTTNSLALAVKTYQFELLPASATAGNKYCLVSVSGSGTSATPDLAQCSKMPYSLADSSTARLAPLFDPPAYFPSGNQAGAANIITYALSGTQWNPFAYTTENGA